MASVCLLSVAPMWVSPRLQKEAEALVGAGHEVVVGYRADGDVARDDAVLAGRRWRWHRIDVARRRAPASWLRSRARQATAQALWRIGIRTGAIARAAYCAGDAALLRWAKAQRADLYIAHAQPTLALAAAAAADRHVPFAFDCEDLLAEEAADGGRAPWRRALIMSLERRHLRSAAYVSATSDPMARHLAETYGLRRVPVWHNCFPLAERRGVTPPSDRRCAQTVELAWVSATIGPGRGLEDVFAALSRVSRPMALHLYGAVTSATAPWVERQLRLLKRRNAVVLHPPVAADGVIATLAAHHIGLSLDGHDCLNRSLTVSNKVFYYIQGGLACVASDTPGHRSVLPSGARYGFLYPPGDVAALAETLDRVALPNVLHDAQCAAWEAGGSTYAWDVEARRVLDAVTTALEVSTGRPAQEPLEASHA